MAGTFTWERGPFTHCPACKEETFGFLSAGGDRLTMRCSSCRYSETEALSPIDKKVFYLDQSIFSILFKVAANGRLPPKHEDFSRELYRRLRELVLLQQVVLPHSDIHSSETIVFHDANELRRAYEHLGGDIMFTESHHVELSQMHEYALAYIEKREPALDFDVDEVLEGERNVWLSDMHIGVNADYSQFANGIKGSRDRTHKAMQDLVEQWARDKPSFEGQLERELASVGTSRRTAFAEAMIRVVNASSSGDPMALLTASLEPILSEFEMLQRLFEKVGVKETEQGRAVNEFWMWERNREQPNIRIFANLFAAFARRVSLGQKKFTQGLMNDIRAIATYAPYVDAMFVDRECAALLGEKPLTTDLRYKARIFSLSDGDAFLAYLDEVEAGAKAEVRAFATRIYGLH